ncbi:MAG: FAD-dependent monooxygenase, partial [Leptospiraceae bacterium]|nr:FAD-dependent monooxygenase [Leptospiraceae bacterium]
TASIGTSSWAIHRGDLQSALLQAASDAGAQIHTDRRLQSVHEDGRVHLEFNNERHARCDLLIGADGIHSVAREYVLGKTAMRSAGQSCWRGVVERSSWSRQWPSHTACEFLGSGSRLGIVPIDASRIYWYATVSESRGIAPNDLVGFYDYFSGWNDFADIITLPQSSPIALPLADRPPVKRWFRDNVVLLGDAVHSTTPNMGQGACMAIESAYVLANLLSELEVARALPAYQAKRYSRTSQVSSRSFRLGQIAQTQNQCAAFIRDGLMRGLQRVQQNSARALLLGGPANSGKS